MIKNKKNSLSGFFFNPPNHLSNEHAPFFLAGMIGGVGTFFAHSFLMVYYGFLGITEMVVYHFFVLPWLLLMIIMIKKGRLTFGFLGMALEFLLHACLGSYCIGLKTGIHHPIIGCIILIVLAPGIPRWLMGLLETAAITCLGLVLYFFQSVPPLYNLAFNQYFFLKIGLAVFDYGLAALAIYFLVFQNKKIYKMMDREKNRAENLLLNILPEQIADRLKDKQEPIADSFENASVLFLDVVGFTKLSARLEARDVVHFLNRLFCRFDDLLDTYGLEKIKTIGDAYMVAAGIPVPVDDHAEKILLMARDMMRAVQSFQSDYVEDLSCRIGICSGPVVAGVIGERKFLYDLWGDTVNTASRMESCGLINEIQVAPSTYELLKDKYTFECRGEMEVKGKGIMKTYIYEEH